MKMSPKDGWVSAPERTWVLAGGPAEPVLIYSLSGADITLAGALPAMSWARSSYACLSASDVTFHVAPESHVRSDLSNFVARSFKEIGLTGGTRLC